LPLLHLQMIRYFFSVIICSMVQGCSSVIQCVANMCWVLNPAPQNNIGNNLFQLGTSGLYLES
jgi:hypothetical protein